MKLLEITSKDQFEKEVLESTQPVMVDFFAPWCGPCRTLISELEKLAEENKDIKIVKVNIDNLGEIAENYGIMSIPTVLFFKNSEVKNKKVGLGGKEDYKTMYKALV